MRLFEEIDLVEIVHCILGSTDRGFKKEDTVKDANVDFNPPTFLTITLKNVEVADTEVVLHPETQLVLEVKYFVSVGTVTSAIK